MGQISDLILHPILASTCIKRIKPTITSYVCNACVLAKSYKFLFLSEHVTAEHAFDLLYINTWGLTPTTGLNGERYFLLVVDDKTRFQWVFFMHTHDQAIPIFLHFEKMV